jgi:hypothetical protein
MLFTIWIFQTPENTEKSILILKYNNSQVTKTVHWIGIIDCVTHQKMSYSLKYIHTPLNFLWMRIYCPVNVGRISLPNIRQSAWAWLSYGNLEFGQILMQMGEMSANPPTCLSLCKFRFVVLTGLVCWCMAYFSLWYLLSQFLPSHKSPQGTRQFVLETKWILSGYLVFCDTFTCKCILAYRNI